MIPDHFLIQSVQMMVDFSSPYCFKVWHRAQIFSFHAAGRTFVRSSLFPPLSYPALYAESRDNMIPVVRFSKGIAVPVKKKFRIQLKSNRPLQKRFRPKSLSFSLDGYIVRRTFTAEHSQTVRRGKSETLR